MDFHLAPWFASNSSKTQSYLHYIRLDKFVKSLWINYLLRQLFQVTKSGAAMKIEE